MKSEHDIFERNVPGLTEKLQQATVGIAGCGGLGSNAAVALTRAGIGKLVLADCDRVETSNLNRQYYFLDDVGKIKVDTLANILTRINPHIRLDLVHKELKPEDIAVVFAEADILIEAFDKAESKQWLIQSWATSFPERPVIIGSGLSGCGGTESLKVHKSGHIYLCGDETTDMSMGLCASRVAIVANMQANIAIELLAGNREAG